MSSKARRARQTIDGTWLLVPRTWLPVGHVLSAPFPDSRWSIHRVRLTVQVFGAVGIHSTRPELGLSEWKGPAPKWRGGTLPQPRSSWHLASGLLEHSPSTRDKYRFDRCSCPCPTGAEAGLMLFSSTEAQGAQAECAKLEKVSPARMASYPEGPAACWNRICSITKAACLFFFACGTLDFSESYFRITPRFIPQITPIKTCARTWFHDVSCSSTYLIFKTTLL